MRLLRCAIVPLALVLSAASAGSITKETKLFNGKDLTGFYTYLGSPGLGETQFPRPVRPGDTLRVVTDIVELRVSASKPDRGVCRLRQVTINQRGEHVMEQETTVFLKRRPMAMAGARS